MPDEKTAYKGGRLHRPVPDDWQMVAPHMTQPELAKHYRTSYRVIKRWVKETSVATSGTQTVMKLPDNLEELAQVHSFRTLAALLKRSPDRLRQRVRIERPDLFEIMAQNGQRNVMAANSIPMPAEFVEACFAGMSRAKLSIDFGVSNTVISRWLNEAGPDAKRAVDAAAKEAIRAAAVASGKKARGTFALKPLCKDNIQRAAVGQVEQAMRYLQRFGACYPRNVHHPILEGYTFVLKPGVLTGDQIIAEAKRRGWNSDAWRELAA